MKLDNVSKEFAGLVGDVWHEWVDTLHRPASETWKFQYKHMCSCGSGVWSNKIHYPIMPCIPNRNYIIELIKARIQARGDWDGFVDEIVLQIDECGIDGDDSFAFDLGMASLADILTTPALLMQAYIAYRRATK